MNWEIKAEVDSIERHIGDLVDEQQYLSNFEKVPNLEDGAVIQFESSRGLTFVAILKAESWWTTSTIGLEANRRYADLPGLLLAFQPSTITVLRKGRTYG